MMAHHQRKMQNKAISIFQQAVNEDPKLFPEARALITAAVYEMCKAIVGFDTYVGNISYFASGLGTRKANTDGSKRKLVRKE
jgi:hypothetical protein